MRGLVQPQDWPCTIASISALDANTSITAPARSGNRLPSGSRDSLKMRAAMTAVTSPIGRLTRKTQRQLAWTRSPPIGGPAPAATAPVADQMATATARWRPENSARSSASDVGMSTAPPAAWTTRAPISHPAPGAAAQRAEATTNVTSPPMKRRLRPSRSARRPAGMRSAAVTGARRFEHFQRRTGAARNVLANRLNLLVEEGIFRKVAYQEHPARYEYRLTEKGIDLWPVIVSLLQWGDRHVYPGRAPVLLVHKKCGGAVSDHRICETCGAQLTARDVEARQGIGGGMAPAGELSA